MTPPPNRRDALSALALLAATVTLPLHAEPARAPVTRGRLVVGSSAGGTMDTLARRITELWARHFDLDYMVERLPGAGGLMAAQRVLAAPADAGTLLLANSGLINVVSQPAEGAARLDLDDLAPLAIVGGTPFFLACAHDGPMRDLADIHQQLGRANLPAIFGIAALYGSGHIAGDLLFRKLGAQPKAVGYTQISQMLLDVATQRLPFTVSGWSSLRPLVEQGRLRIITACSARRVPFVPEAPALAEQGYADCAHEGWTGLFHRRETPRELLQAHARALDHMLRGTPPQLNLEDIGSLNVYLDAEQAAHFVRREIQRHRQLLRQNALS